MRLRNMKHVFFGIFIALLIANTVGADSEIVSKITIRENKIIEDDAIFAVISLKKGDPISEAVVSNDIQAIFRLGYFVDVRVETAKEGDGWAVVYVVTEKPIVQNLELKGNKKIENEELLCTLKTK